MTQPVRVSKFEHAKLKVLHRPQEYAVWADVAMLPEYKYQKADPQPLKHGGNVAIA